ncbi:MAG: tRNA (adenosine(37)-N6)-dimethylallyltransferase MiaA [Rhodospirillales bacterium]|nr:tRNA (adenosine(37)-N6)-dimethylallyltransferase MiaA [Rhodospirillales bacterium]
MTRQPLLIVAGPTASGKSGLALALAVEFNGTVINADSMQLYRGLEILTAQPDAAARARAPHLLYGVLDLATPASAGKWRDMALDAIAEARAAGRLPILVGGTGLYLRTLLQGIAPIPAVPAAIRDAARVLHTALGGPAFRARLAERDPEGAARLNPGDTQRLIRAYEVVEATGRPLAYWQAQQAEGGDSPFRPFVLTVMPPRPVLHKSINERFLRMIGQGALDEVRAVLARRLDPMLPGMKALGVAELRRHLDGALPLAQAVALAQTATRQYAKRQATWFRHQLPPDYLLNAQFSERLLPEIFSIIRQFLLTP